MKQSKLLIVGLTGNSGSGKSTIASYFTEKYKVLSIDGDKVGHSLYHTDSPAYKELVSELGSGILDDESGHISRKKLSQLVFQEEDKRLVLNSISHYHIRQIILDLIQKAQSSKLYDAVLIDAALLLQSDIKHDLDYVWSVVSNTEHRIERLLQRDQIPLEAIEKRIASQWENNLYIEKSDEVIENRWGLVELYNQCDKLAEKYHIQVK